LRGRGDTASTDIRECAEGAQRAEQARLRAVVRSACGGHSGVSLSTRELCERWLPQAASASEARACRRDGAQTGQRAEPACTQRAGKPLCTPPAVDSASPPRFLARVLEGEQVLEHAQHARPARPARRHTRAARSPHRAARTARLGQQEQLEEAAEALPVLHAQPAHWKSCGHAGQCACQHGRRTRTTRATARRTPATAHHAARSRQQPQRPAGPARATPGDTAFSAGNLPCLALPCLAWAGKGNGMI